MQSPSLTKLMWFTESVLLLCVLISFRERANIRRPSTRVKILDYDY